VILSARDEDSGQKACGQLAADGCNAKFIPLDVTSKESIFNAAEKIRVDYEGLDILVNNAGIMYSSSKCKDTPYTSQVEATLKTNFYGVLNVCEIMFPLLNENARVVNVTSRLGNMKLYGEDIRNMICSKKLDKHGLLDLMQQYSSAVKNNTHVMAGWPDQNPNSWVPAAYCVSKLALTILTRILAKDWKAKGVLINSCCPGWCRSSLGGQNAPKSAEEGAADIVDVTMKQSNGSYWEDGKENFNILPCEAPMVRIKNVSGYDGKCNDVVFCGEDAMQHVVFFPGDVQNYREEMEE